MPLNELEQLSDLVRLRLPVNFLEVQELRDTGVDEDVMASAHATESEPECFCERAGFGKAEVVRGRERPLEELAGIHFLEGNASTQTLGASSALSSTSRVLFADGFQTRGRNPILYESTRRRPRGER